MTSPKGSIWRRWDLHFHTPSLFDYRNKGVDDKKIIEVLKSNNVSAVAITDHHVIEVSRIRSLQETAKGEITFFPGIELRSELGGIEHVHFIGIFPENCNLEELRDKIAGKLNLTDADIKREGNDKIYKDFLDTAKLIHDLGGLVSVHAGSKTNSIERIANTPHFKQKIKEDLAKEAIDILEIGNIEDAEVYRKIVFPDIKHVFPVVMCSDNHNIEEYACKEILWIKGDTTFEGLRQVLFEPEYRVHLGTTPPLAPVYKIGKVSFDFPDTTLIGSDEFCLRGKSEVHFSPNFTCLIGGRGSGKSTILNLVYEKINPGKNEFFRKLPLTNAKIQDCTKIDDGKGEQFVEFLSQNEIEEFATNQGKFTEAIYLRLIRLDSSGRFNEFSKKLQEHLQTVDDQIARIEKRKTLKRELEIVKQSAKSYQDAATFLTDSEYLALSDQLKEKSGQLSTLRTSKEKLKDLVTELRRVLKNYPLDSEDLQNAYQLMYKKIWESIDEFLKKYDQPGSFEDVEQSEEKLDTKVREVRSKLDALLRERGLSEENLLSISEANERISELQSSMKKYEIASAVLEDDIAKYQHETNLKGQIENLYKEKIKPVSELLKDLNEQVKPISLVYEFDSPAALITLRDLVLKKLTEAYPTSRIRSDYVEEILFKIPPQQVNNHIVFLESLSSTDKTTTKLLKEFFDSKDNFDIYKLMIQKVLDDVDRYKIIRVLYDGKPLHNTSFGQRCTATIVVLLLLGNNPLIIDEPEAHLDSPLIADYLVGVIKKIKQHRQIFFATHNANFVINGDAELVNILLIDAQKRTVIVPTTIENLDHREELLALEGGREAFAHRELRYRT